MCSLKGPQSVWCHIHDVAIVSDASNILLKRIHKNVGPPLFQNQLCAAVQEDSATKECRRHPSGSRDRDPVSGALVVGSVVSGRAGSRDMPQEPRLVVSTCFFG